MPRDTTQPVRLSGDLIKLLREQAKKSGRSIPMEAEQRLRQSLEAGPVDELGHRVAPWARAVGWLVAILADELAAYSRRERRAAKLKFAVAKVLDRVLTFSNEPAELDDADREQAENFAEYLWLKMMNADQPSREERTRSHSHEQLALLEIRQNLFPEKDTAPSTK